jgi:hypothetical protein
MVVTVVVVMGPDCLQCHFARQLSVGGVPGVDEETGLRFMKL